VISFDDPLNICSVGRCLLWDDCRSGFRSLEEIATHLKSYPELRALVSEPGEYIGDDGRGCRVVVTATSSSSEEVEG